MNVNHAAYCHARRVAIKSVLTVGVMALTIVGCSSGYTQEEVDALVAEAVNQAVAEEQTERISGEEAQTQAEEAARQASLVAAVESCASSAYITVDAGGLVMESKGDESPGASVAEVMCVLTALDTPDSVVTRISNTNSTMGLVEGAWGEHEATWSYHPDNGLFIHVVVSG
jgi:hypothetical protein